MTRRGIVAAVLLARSPRTALAGRSRGRGKKKQQPLCSRQPSAILGAEEALHLVFGEAAAAQFGESCLDGFGPDGRG